MVRAHSPRPTPLATPPTPAPPPTSSRQSAGKEGDSIRVVPEEMAVPLSSGDYVGYTEEGVVVPDGLLKELEHARFLVARHVPGCCAEPCGVRAGRVRDRRAATCWRGARGSGARAVGATAWGVLAQ